MTRICSAALALFIATGAAGVDTPEPLALFAPFIGSWGVDPESEFVRQNPERRDFVAFRLEWLDPGRKTLRFIEGVPAGDVERRILDNFVTFNPRTGEILGLGYQLENDFLYESTFRPLGDDGFEREYKVTYPAHQELSGEEDRSRGWIRYRDSCRLTASDRLHCRTEQMREGQWRPWGPPEGFTTWRLPAAP